MAVSGRISFADLVLLGLDGSTPSAALPLINGVINMTSKAYHMSGAYTDDPKPKDFYLKLEDQPDGSVKLIAVDSTGTKLRSGDLLTINFAKDKNLWYVFLHSGINDELPFLFSDDHTLYTKQEHK